MLARISKAMAKKDSGFTLIELLVVVIIIGILAAIAIPTFLNQRQNGWQAQAQSDLRNLVTAAESYAVANNGVYTDLASDYAATPDVLLEGLDLNVNPPVVASSTQDDFCLTVVHPDFATPADGTYSYRKTVDQIVNAAC